MNVLGLSQPYMWMTIKSEKKNAHSIWLPMENQYNKLVP